MASNPPGNCCSRGFKHEGVPQGALETLDGVEAYITGDKSSSKLIADLYADQGYLVVAPDIYFGDFVPLNLDGFDAPSWIAKHNLEVTQSIVDKAYAYIVKTYNPKTIVSAGYCVGARYTIRLLGESKISAGVAFHPSFVTIEEVAAIKKPLFIAAAGTDTIFTEQQRQQTEDKLREIKATYYITVLSQVEHGFAVRGDPSKAWERPAKEKAFADSIWWYSLFD